jgi:hypothetical protein
MELRLQDNIHTPEINEKEVALMHIDWGMTRKYETKTA